MGRRGLSTKVIQPPPAVRSLRSDRKQRREEMWSVVLRLTCLAGQWCRSALPTSHWPELSHMATLTSREPGKCGLAGCPGRKEKNVGRRQPASLVSQLQISGSADSVLYFCDYGHHRCAFFLRVCGYETKTPNRKTSVSHFSDFLAP